MSSSAKATTTKSTTRPAKRARSVRAALKRPKKAKTETRAADITPPKSPTIIPAVQNAVHELEYVNRGLQAKNVHARHSIVSDSATNMPFAMKETAFLLACGHLERHGSGKKITRHVYAAVKSKLTKSTRRKVELSNGNSVPFYVRYYPCGVCDKRRVLVGYFCPTCGAVKHDYKPIACVQGKCLNDSLPWNDRVTVCRGRTLAGRACSNAAKYNNLLYCKVHLRTERTMVWLRKAFEHSARKQSVPFPGEDVMNLIKRLIES